MAPLTNIPAKFDPVDVTSTPYKVVNGHEIPAYTFIPKGLEAGKYPLMVTIHGGGVVTGSTLYPEWFADWLIDYVVKNNIILVGFDYRLLPEARGIDVLEDVKDFWAWLKRDFSGYLEKTHPGFEVDFDKIAVHGGSAGGYLALLSGLLQPSLPVKAVIAMYPMADLDSDFYAKPREIASYAGEDFPAPPFSVVEEHIAKLAPGAIVTASEASERMAIVGAAIHHGRFKQLLGDEDELYPFRLLEKVDQIPYIFLAHGTDDLPVPVEGSVKFAKLVKEKFGEDSVDLFTGPGPHGFDSAWTLKAPALKEFLPKVEKAWLQ